MKKLNKLYAALGIFLLILSFGAQAKPPAEDIKFIDLDGKVTHLSDYKGKWVVVNLWATWCPPCLVEIPDLVLFHEEHHEKDAIVIGVNYEDTDPQKVKAFADSQMINYPVVRFEGKVDGRTSPFGPLNGLPTTYMVAPDGTVVAGRTGMVDEKMLNDFIKNYSQISK
ncbi:MULTISPECIES: TlpA disulfide reductase family protein [Thiomicrorhabdus]|uniref:TlpA family protein disulfide reductase n=1 Tax=Thiomicrorhabdus heinhorstiae TaxID=2748010 RepID=A0ABS0C225_9GAMM|nr:MULTISPECIES: TlpA disulfide reductase family protein [Thiomicrorhabdus]MBF6058261.1 TlpA family protein disulfide reductase [Thiomicrorhabdus heinhorstiae]